MCNVRNVRIFLGELYREIEVKTVKRAEGTVGSKIIRALEIMWVKKLMSKAIL